MLLYVFTEVTVLSQSSLTRYFVPNSPWEYNGIIHYPCIFSIHSVVKIIGNELMKKGEKQYVLVHIVSKRYYTDECV